MYRKFKIVKIDSKYCDYLRNFDEKVIYNAFDKELRPFIGVLFIVGKYEYFAPLSSPKEKHKRLKNQIDLIKIEDGKLGVIIFNNMVPEIKYYYGEFNFNIISYVLFDYIRIYLMKKQLRWLTTNKKEIYTKSKLLYNLYKNNKKSSNVRNR